jgi:hypothetical protein
MEIIINNSKVLRTEDRMTLAEFLELAEHLKPFIKYSGFSVKTEVVIPAQSHPAISTPTPARTQWYVDGKDVTGKTKPVPPKPYIKYKTKRKMRHKWLNREHALEAIRIHYTGTAQEKEAFAKKEGMDWLELSKGFSMLMKRFKMKPSEIGLTRFTRDRSESLASSPYDNNLKRKERRDKSGEDGLMKQIYDLRQSGMDFADIKRQVGVSNNEARRLFKRYYNRIYQQGYKQSQRSNQPQQEQVTYEPQQENITFAPPTQEEHPNIKIAEQHLVQFFSEINRHTPEQIKQTINLLSNFLKNVKGRKGDRDDILDFLNQYFPNQLTPIVNPDDIDNWLVN